MLKVKIVEIKSRYPICVLLEGKGIFREANIVVGNNFRNFNLLLDKLEKAPVTHIQWSLILDMSISYLFKDRKIIYSTNIVLLHEEH